MNGAASGGMARFLVVDDDPSTLSAMASLLTAAGHSVFASSGGGSGVNALCHNPFDVVMTDLEMPGIDGRAILRTARERSPRAVLVVVSGRGTELAEELKAAGADIIADKPLDYDALAQALADNGVSRVKLESEGPDAPVQGSCPSERPDRPASPTAAKT